MRRSRSSSLSSVCLLRLPYQADFYEHDQKDLLYLVDRESLSIFRWSTMKKVYLDSWSLLNPPNWVTLSATHNRLYLGYSNGKITYFDLSQTAPVETHFTNLAIGTLGLLAVGDFLFAADASGAWATHYSMDKNGTIVDSKDWRDTGSQYIWNPVLSRVYHQRDNTSPNDIVWTELDPTSGVFRSQGDSPYHGEMLVTRYPIRVNDNGQYLLNGAGQIIDATSLTVLNALANNIADGIWVNDQLVTIDKNVPALQLWGANFELWLTIL